MQRGVGQRDTAANKKHMNASFHCDKARKAPSCRTQANMNPASVPTVIRGMSSRPVAQGARGDIPGRPPVRGWHHLMRFFSEGGIPRLSHAPTDARLAAGIHFLKLIRCCTPPCISQFHSISCSSG